MPKIFISPSNQNKNVYAYGNTNESAECKQIADYLEKALIRCGFKVKTMHTETIAKKVQEADKWGADLYVPIHTNAHDRKTGGTRVFYWANNTEGHSAAKCVYEALKGITEGTSDNLYPQPNLYEVKYPKAQTVYIEAEFHDVPKYAKWIIENKKEIAEAICKGICNHYKKTYIAEKLYKVQVGAFQNKANAEMLKDKLKADGYDAFII